MKQPYKKVATITALRLHIFSHRIHILIVLSTVTLFFMQGNAQLSTSKPDWSSFQFLLGEWTGEGSGNPGQRNGTFIFSMGLQDHIILRHNQSDYPETKTRATFSHNDLMVIYQTPGPFFHAIYFDNENHTIQYNTHISIDRKSIVFISDSAQAGPQFKLTYTSLADDSLLITFEIAPPGQPENFSKYLEGRAHRTTQNPEIKSEKKKR